LVANELYVPWLRANDTLTTGNHRNLQAVGRTDPNGLLGVGSIGEILASTGKTMAVVSSGSTGSALLNHHTGLGPIFNTKDMIPKSLTEAAVGRFGPIPTIDSPNNAQNSWLADLLCQELLPERRPTLTHIWINEPDHIQHQFGIGSSEAVEGIKHADAMVGRVIETLQQLHIEDTTDVILTADHGFSTGYGEGRMDERLVEAGLKREPKSADVIVDSARLHVNDTSDSRSLRLAEWLTGQSDVGLVFAESETAGKIGCFDRKTVWQDHHRSSTVMAAGTWDSEVNETGFPGRSSISGTAGHGTASPFDLERTLIMCGPSFAEGVVSDTPCGIIDIAPTTLSILGVDESVEMDGRVLRETFRNNHAAPDVAYETMATQSQEQRLEFAQVESTRYLLGSAGPDQNLGAPVYGASAALI
jgi:hypothetical protein